MSAEKQILAAAKRSCGYSIGTDGPNWIWLVPWVGMTIVNNVAEKHNMTMRLNLAGHKVFYMPEMREVIV